jgi:predicted NodU family carbamoyl transferase
VGPYGLISTLGSDSRQDYEATKHRWHNRIRAFASGARGPQEPAGNLAADPAAVRMATAVQTTVERVVGWLADQAREMTGIRELCIAEGVGLNCAANAACPVRCTCRPSPTTPGWLWARPGRSRRPASRRS